MTTATRGVINADAFTALWREQRDAVRGFLYRRAPGVADELTSETFTKAWAARATFDPTRGEPRPWLFTVARNVLADWLRYEARRPVVFWPDMVPSAPADASDVAAEVADRVTVAALLEALPARCRLVLVLRFALDLDVADTAAAIGCAAGTVKSATSRAAQQARELVGGVA